ncbi:PAS domain S-box protein [Thiorhodococcus fuscus]|uniref:histidine kinase n=1 Tax=Thiorhodococcus fuscus TaxID=527200 RepID=A0ABW4YDK2_9GAMM
MIASQIRLLLLEDSSTDAELTERALRRAGLIFEARRVQDRSGFVSALETFRPDAVLADCSLPRFDGADALHLVRAAYADLPFIFVTRAIGEEKAVELLRSGASDYVLKDRLTRLPAALDRALDAVRQRQALSAAQQALRESEARFRAIVETTQDWIWEVDAQCVYTYVSPASRPLLGYDPEEVLGRRPFDLMDPEEGERAAARFAEFSEARRPFLLLESRCLSKDGREVVLETSGTPFFNSDGAFLGYRGVDRDITERRRLGSLSRFRAERAALLLELPREAQRLKRNELELALEESRERLALALDGSDLALWDWMVQTGEIRFNERWAQMLGYSLGELLPTSVETIGALCHPEDLEKVRVALGRHFAGADSHFECEVRFRHRDGDWVWGLDCGKVVDWDAKGRPLRMAGTRLDITARKSAEEALLKLSLAVEQSPSSIVITDLNARIEYVNPAFTQVSGYSFEEVREQNPRILASGQTPKTVHAELWQTLARGEVWRGEFLNRRKDGVEYVERASISPVRQPDGRITHYLAVKEDITERKRFEEERAHYRQHLEELVETRTLELRLAEERSRLILESSADGIYGEDTEGRVTFINPAACAMLGYAPDQVLGRCMHDLVHHHYPDGRVFPRAECPMSGSLGDVRVVHQEPLVFWRADGSSLPVAYSAHPMLRDGVVVGRVVSFFDTSAHQQTERAREAALAEAERLARLKSEFLANMSHEIRTPLNAVLGFAQVGIRENDPHKARDFFRRIMDSGQLLLGIVNGILDFSKIEAGKLVIAREPVDLRRLIRRAEEQIRERALDKGLRFHVELAPDLPAICQGDDLRLAQILANLLSNAVKFTERGQVSLALSRVGGRLLLRVSDTGIGMSERQVGTLFQPFTQADGSITRRFGGTGLGLAITKRLVDMMGGEIGVHSDLDKGTCFEVGLPLIDPVGSIRNTRDGLPEVAAAFARERLRGLIILVAEDNETNRLVLEEMLNFEGCWMVAVSNGQQAVERVRQDGAMAFDLVLMDIQMPVMDGYEATRRIVALAPELPVVGLTAHAMASERNQCLAAGMADHLAKPVELDVLVEVVLRHTHARRSGAGQDSSHRLARARLSSSPEVDTARPGAGWVDWEALEKRYRQYPGFTPKLLGTALQANGEHAQVLRKAAQSGDLARVAFVAHSLKGTARNLFASGFSELAGAAERSARDGRPDAASRARQLADALDGLLLEIRARQPCLGGGVETIESSASDSIDLDALTQVVARLESLLSMDDTAVNQSFERDEPLLIRAFGEEARRLGRDIRAFEYSRALASLRSIWQRWRLA